METSEQRATPMVNPSTGEVLGRSPLDDEAAVREAVARAREAQRSWGALSPRERGRRLRPVLRRLLREAHALSEEIHLDNGKTRTDALATEILPAVLALCYYIRKAPRFLAPSRPRPATLLLAHKRSRVVRVPWGVVGIISPWNYPFAIPFSEVAMALLAGNGVVLKTSSETQLVGRRLFACFQEADLPGGLFAFVNLPGREAGPAFLAAGVDKLFFTGSTSAGKELMALAAKTLTPLCLELGGKDPMLVCEDADLYRAAAGAVWAGFQNCGQSCGGVERIYVHERVYDAFVEKLAARVRALRVGGDGGEAVDVGAMTTSRQLETVKAHVEEAVALGARVAARAPAPEGTSGLFHPMVVLTHVDHSMRVMREETFGPVVGVMKVREMEEAVALANDSPYGLTASVWSRNRRRARALARKLQAGVVTINDHLMSHGLPETPWGGFKASGLGRTHGAEGFAEMTQPQVVVDDFLSMLPRAPWWHPHDGTVYRGLSALLFLLAGKPWERVQALPAVFRLFSRCLKR